MFDSRSLSVALACLIALATPAQAEPSGLWREKDGGTIRVYRCNAGYCGTIASVVPPLDRTGQPARDQRNPDPAKRDRPLVGVVVLTDMRPNGPGKWSGRLYDSDRGKVFEGNLVEVDANTIRIEGCAMDICAGEALTRVK